MQPSARPQGVPVGPQSTCHAPDRGASTLWIPQLGLRCNRQYRYCLQRTQDSPSLDLSLPPVKPRRARLLLVKPPTAIAAHV